MFKNPYTTPARKSKPKRTIKMAKGGEVAGGPNDMKLKEAEQKFGKYKGTENKRSGHPILNAISNAMRGNKATRDANKGYKKRQKRLIEAKIKKAGG